DYAGNLLIYRRRTLDVKSFGGIDDTRPSKLKMTLARINERNLSILSSSATLISPFFQRILGPEKGAMRRTGLKNTTRNSTKRRTPVRVCKWKWHGQSRWSHSIASQTLLTFPQTKKCLHGKPNTLGCLQT